MTRLVLLLLLLPLPVLAQLIGGPNVPNTWQDGAGWRTAPAGQGLDGTWSVLPDRGAGGVHTTSCTTVTCTRTGSVPGPLGRPQPTLSPSAAFPKGNIVKGALLLGRNVLPWLATGYGLYEWWKSANLDMGSDGGITQTQGGSTRATTVYCRNGECTGSTARLYGSVQAYAVDPVNVRSAMVSISSSSTEADLLRYEISGANPWAVKYFHKTNQNTWIVYVYQIDGDICVDSSGRNIGVKPTAGVCPAGSPVPVTVAQAETALNSAPVTADQMRRALEEVFKAGGQVVDDGAHKVAGPSSAPGETRQQVTTTPTGTQAVTNYSTTYNYTYNNNTFNITKTETTTKPDGSTETTSTNKPDDSQCVKFPDTLGCAKFGDLPTDQPTWQTKTITYQPDNLGFGGSCPAPWTGVVHGWTLSFSYQPACDVAPTIRAGLLALSTLGALLMIVTAVRT